MSNFEITPILALIGFLKSSWMVEVLREPSIAWADGAAAHWRAKSEGADWLGLESDMGHIAYSMLIGPFFLGGGSGDVALQHNLFSNYKINFPTEVGRYY